MAPRARCTASQGEINSSQKLQPAPAGGLPTSRVDPGSKVLEVYSIVLPWLQPGLKERTKHLSTHCVNLPCSSPIPDSLRNAQKAQRAVMHGWRDPENARTGSDSPAKHSAKSNNLSRTVSPNGAQPERRPGHQPRTGRRPVKSTSNARSLGCEWSVFAAAQWSWARRGVYWRRILLQLKTAAG